MANWDQYTEATKWHLAAQASQIDAAIAMLNLALEAMRKTRESLDARDPYPQDTVYGQILRTAVPILRAALHVLEQVVP